MIYILAGREYQARDWARSQGLVWRAGPGSKNKQKATVKYIFDANTLRGAPRGLLFVRIGTWYICSQRDRDEIETVLQAREAIELDQHSFRDAPEYQAMVAQQ